MISESGYFFGPPCNDAVISNSFVFEAQIMQWQCHEKKLSQQTIL